MQTEWIAAGALVLTALIGQMTVIVGMFRRHGKELTEIKGEVHSPNGTTTGETVHDILQGQEDLLRGMSYLARKLGTHLSDGHGGE